MHIQANMKIVSPQDYRVVKSDILPTQNGLTVRGFDAAGFPQTQAPTMAMVKIAASQAIDDGEAQVTSTTLEHAAVP
jgi:hypothetical protein